MNAWILFAGGELLMIASTITVMVMILSPRHLLRPSVIRNLRKICVAAGAGLIFGAKLLMSSFSMGFKIF